MNIHKKTILLLGITFRTLAFSQQGNVGVNTASPTNTLDVNGDLRIRKIQNPNSNENIYNLVSNEDGVVKKVESKDIDIPGVPKVSIYQLQQDQTNFLQNAASGYSQVIPFTPISENAKGVSYNSSTKTFTFQPGLYTITVVYEADHNANCTLSSYFVDFPTSSPRVRIHSTASHSSGTISNHGGNIIYSFEATQVLTWQPNLGRGQSGNCNGAGMTLYKTSTELNIVSYDK